MANNVGGQMFSMRQIVLGIVAGVLIIVLAVALYVNKEKLTSKADENIDFVTLMKVKSGNEGALITKDFLQKNTEKYCTPKGQTKQIRVADDIRIYVKEYILIDVKNIVLEDKTEETTHNPVGIERIVLVSGENVTVTEREVYYIIAKGTPEWQWSKEEYNNTHVDLRGYQGLLRRNSTTTKSKCGLQATSNPS